MRYSLGAALALLAGVHSPVLGQRPGVSRDTIATTIVGPEQTAQVRITFERQLAAGRQILGGVVPFGVPWLLGTITPAELRTFTSLQIGDLWIPPGTYALWARPTLGGATLIVSRPKVPGGVVYDSNADVGRVTMVVDTLASPVDQFTIRFHRARVGPDEVGTTVNRSGSRETLVMQSGTAVSLVISWDRFRWITPLTAPDTVRHRP